MPPRLRVAALAVALALLVALDLAIARVDVFAPLLPDTRPTTLWAGINLQLTEVVSALYGPPPGPPPVVLLGNSQLAAGIEPLGLLARRLVEAGAAPGTHAVSLCVFGTAPTDAEVLARSLGRMRPGLAILGLGAPDLGTPLERARAMPVTRMLDTGLSDGLVPPADWEARLDRWVRTPWHLYRYRTLFHDLALPSRERRTPNAQLEEVLTTAQLLAQSVGPARVPELLALREAFARSRDPADFLRYVEALRGPDYLSGLRERWRALQPQPLQLEALRRFAAHVRAAGGRPVWLLLPENPLLERDPEVGVEVARRSEEIAGVVAAEAATHGVPVLDLRRSLPPDAFVDLNHLRGSSGVMFPVLVDALERRQLL